MSKKKVHLHYQTGPIFRTSVQLSYVDYITSCLVLITLYNIRKNTSYQEEQANIIFFFSYSRHTCYTFICAIKKLGNIPHCIHVVVCRVSEIPSYELGTRSPFWCSGYPTLGTRSVTTHRIR